MPHIDTLAAPRVAHLIERGHVDAEKIAALMVARDNSNCTAETGAGLSPAELTRRHRVYATEARTQLATPAFVPAPTIAVPSDPAWKAPGWRPTDEQLHEAHLIAIREGIGYGAALDRILGA